MKEVERKDMPEVSGGKVDSIENPLPIVYPICPVPIEPISSPMIVPESPLS